MRQILIQCIRAALVDAFTLKELQRLKKMLDSGELGDIFYDAVLRAIQTLEANNSQGDKE